MIAQAQLARTRASPEERCSSLFLVGLYVDQVTSTKVLKSLSERPGGPKTLNMGRLLRGTDSGATGQPGDGRDHAEPAQGSDYGGDLRVVIEDAEV